MLVYEDDVSDIEAFSLTNGARSARDPIAGSKRPYVVVDQAGHTWMQRHRGDHYRPRRFASEQNAKEAIKLALRTKQQLRMDV